MTGLKQAAIRGLACAVLILPGIVSAQDESPRQQWQKGIAAAYSDLASTSQSLANTTRRYCQAPSDAGRTTLVDSWRKAYTAWQAVRYVDFGPIEQNSRAWQLQFWPDSKNLIARKANYWLGQDAPVTADQVNSDSVALQGFPAMEYLLFDQQPAKRGHALPEAQACSLAVAIAEHIQTTSQSLSDDWAAFTPHYVEGEQYTATTVKAALNGVEIIQDKRLAAPMGLRGNGSRNGYLADAWRSGESLTTIKASIKGLQTSFLPGAVTLLKQNDQAKLATKLSRQFERTLKEFDALPHALAPLLETDDGYRKLQGLFIEVSQLDQIINNNVAPALGITRGFNSSDGD
ncbi:imelysin family protein [Marinobacter sp. BGYM27]|uniref:imelysin family protein n=1 Tax=Marinobacter sp. BGYM27 TaxID=2975597 RepID=UPI0021A25E6E|nr:imelysin family protein [Marinobacter sp. BGYM27]MDG5499415.1 imelysin family protein [Marinobacter sp. BGYM27]